MVMPNDDAKMVMLNGDVEWQCEKAKCSCCLEDLMLLLFMVLLKQLMMVMLLMMLLMQLLVMLKLLMMLKLVMLMLLMLLMMLEVFDFFILSSCLSHLMSSWLGLLASLVIGQWPIMKPGQQQIMVT